MYFFNANPVVLLKVPLIYTDHHLRHHGDRASPDAYCWCQIFVNQHCDFNVKSLLEYYYVTYKCVTARIKQPLFESRRDPAIATGSLVVS